MLTAEEQALLGNAVVIRLRLAQVQPREWSESDYSRPDPKRHRGSEDGPPSVQSWPGSDEGARVWGGPVPEVVGTSSVASRDAPMITPDENMSSAGGGSLGSPGIEPHGAFAGVFMATTVLDEQMRAPEQPATYVPPTYAAGPQPGATAPASPAPRDQTLDEEMKAEVPGANDMGMARLAEEQATSHQALQDAQRQIAELQMAMAARDEQERIRIQEYQRTLQAQTAERDLNRAERKQQKTLTRKQEVEAARRKEAANIEIASLHLRLHQVEEQQAREQDAVRREAAEAIARDADRLRAEAAAAVEAAAERARQEEAQAKRALQHQLQEERARPALEQERLDAQEAELRSLHEQVAAVAERSRARERSTSAGSTDRAGATRQRRP
ncbi:unnamed protein product [Phytophthora lilii]|uniref:Unnamed protein product n=1 Tax=Phytophthora lilii TaxID=2077276 RepID=A0A9W6UAM1_9STRA|nr:unnamed protein product [Phytophthora lilii]